MKLNILDLSRDAPALVLRVFWRYVQVMRDIQSTYWLEPAGSHGVWGLDDYHFLPFLWGSAQLRDHKHLRPKAIHDAEILEEFSKDYMYFSCIHFINSVSLLTFSHSPSVLLTLFLHTDQDRLAAMALAHARRYLRCADMGKGQ